MANKNCLLGVRCPQCGQDKQFTVAATVSLMLTDEGTGDYSGDVEYDDASRFECYECNHVGPFKEFQDPEVYNVA